MESAIVLPKRWTKLSPKLIYCFASPHFLEPCEAWMDALDQPYVPVNIRRGIRNRLLVLRLFQLYKAPDIDRPDIDTWLDRLEPPTTKPGYISKTDRNALRDLVREARDDLAIANLEATFPAAILDAHKSFEKLFLNDGLLSDTWEDVLESTSASIWSAQLDQMRIRVVGSESEKDFKAQLQAACQKQTSLAQLDWASIEPFFDYKQSVVVVGQDSSPCVHSSRQSLQFVH